MEIKDKVATVESLGVLFNHVNDTIDETKIQIETQFQTKLDNKSDNSHVHDYLSLDGGTLNGDIKFINNHGRIYGVDYSQDENGVVKEVFVGQTQEGNTSLGYGNYDIRSGSTNIYGNSITMSSITAGLDKREYGVNEVLWEGNIHMNSDQIIVLSDTVSHQPNGIVLVWSEYDNMEDVVENQGFITHFIPKILIELQPNKFHTFNFTLWYNQSKHFIKGLYIDDGIVTGHSVNTNQSDPAAPVNYCVLRYIIGV